VKRSEPDIAGRYATAGRYMNTDAGRREFPTPVEVAPLMAAFGAWLRSQPATADAAFEAHRRLVDIHPFNDGNGRTARLLMNLILIRGGFPPVVVRLEDRLAYLRAVQTAQAGRGDEDFRRLLYQRLDAALAESLDALQRALPGAQ
jgi:Fic family protein